MPRPKRFEGRACLVTGGGRGIGRAVALALGDEGGNVGVMARTRSQCEAVGDELGGVAVEIAARVMARAGSGEVLVSSTVKDLVAGSGIAFEDVDVRLLAGAGGTWRLYRVPSGPDGAGRTPPGTGAGATTDRRAGWLSRREREVADLVAHGRSNREIAEELSIAVATAERHVANIMNKLGYHSRAQVAAWAVEHGLGRIDFE